MGRPVAAAVVVRLRFAVEIVPAKGALGSSRDKSFIISVRRSYCRVLEQEGPFIYEQFNSTERLSGGSARADLC